MLMMLIIHYLLKAIMSVQNSLNEFVVVNGIQIFLKMIRTIKMLWLHEDIGKHFWL